MLVDQLQARFGTACAPGNTLAALTALSHA
jgi:hypothetical protein